MSHLVRELDSTKSQLDASRANIGQFVFLMHEKYLTTLCIYKTILDL